MRRRWIFMLLLALPAVAVAVEQVRCDPAGGQGELNACASDSYAAADRELNATYEVVLQRHADRPQFIANLKKAQRLWIEFRDAEVAMRYPVPEGESAQLLYGSTYPMCVRSYLAELTRQRTAQLRAWLNGIPEGDVCAGSLPRATLSPSPTDYD